MGWLTVERGGILMQFGNDFLSQQIHGAGSGLGTIITLGKGQEPGSQIVLPKKQTGTFHYKQRLEELLQNHAYKETKQYLKILRATVSTRDYLNLELWFYTRVQTLKAAELRRLGLDHQIVHAKCGQLKLQLKALSEN